MSEADSLKETRRWLRYAREDLSAAESTLDEDDVLPRHVCWLAQQAAEKALKAVLIYLQIEYPRSHDLDLLRNLVPDGWRLKVKHPDLAGLTEWAVEARYPGDWPEAVEADARLAVRQAQALWDSVCADLMLHGFVLESPL
jgi:HEPN domain-containing protein